MDHRYIQNRGDILVGAWKDDSADDAPVSQRKWVVSAGPSLVSFIVLEDRLNNPGTGLSGRQQQRLCIAHTIAVNPEVILMDEPCSVDPIATARIEDLLDELRASSAIVTVTHSMQQAARVSQRTAYFHLGWEKPTASSPIPGPADRGLHHGALRLEEPGPLRYALSGERLPPDKGWLGLLASHRVASRPTVVVGMHLQLSRAAWRLLTLPHPEVP